MKTGLFINTEVTYSASLAVWFKTVCRNCSDEKLGGCLTLLQKVSAFFGNVTYLLKKATLKISPKLESFSMGKICHRCVRRP